MILPIELQCTNLQLSQELKRLGARQDSQFYWAIGKLDKKCFLINEAPEKDTMLNLEKPTKGKHFIQEIGSYCAAFTTGELGFLIPEQFGIPIKTESSGWCWDLWIIELKNFTGINDTIESNARAKELIYLIKNGLIDVPKERT